MKQRDNGLDLLRILCMMPVAVDCFQCTTRFKLKRVVPYGLLCTAGIFLVCCLVEWVRKQLFHLLGIQRTIDRLCDRIQEKYSSDRNS